MMQMKRLGATGLSVNNNQIQFKIPKSVQELNQKEFEKKKKKRKLAKKSRKKR